MNMHRSSAHYATLETKDEATGGDEPNVEKAIADLTATFETRMSAVAADLKKATDKATDLETRMNRPSGTDRKEGALTDEQKAFASFVRRGGDRLTADETKALRVADKTAGGYLAPEQFSAELIRNVVRFSPIRQAARVGAMTSDAIKIPKRLSRITARWVGEIETRLPSEPSYGQVEIPAHTAAVYVDVSNTLLEDSALDIAAELAFDFAEEFGRLEGEAFVLGDGVKRPLGFMADTTIPTVPSGVAANLTPESLLALMYDLAPFYRGRGTWLMNGPTIGKVRSMKDAQGRFIWIEGIAEGQPATLLGRPVVETVDMPDLAAGATPIAFGDWSSAYRIYDRVGLTVLRDPYTMATNDITRFHARRRVGGSVVQSEAVRKLRIAAN